MQTLVLGVVSVFIKPLFGNVGEVVLVLLLGMWVVVVWWQDVVLWVKVLFVPFNTALDVLSWRCEVIPSMW